MLKVLLILIGSLSLSIGVIGIAVPGLPTTPFFLLSAACYMRSSAKLYNWIINHRIIGKYIRIYQEHKAMTMRSKIIALLMMWTMIGISAFIIIDNMIIVLVILAAGILGTIVIIRIKTYSQK